MNKRIVKPSILPGFMELLPSEQILFNKMLDIIRKNYEKFGFLPINTPIIEKSEILLAKGGGDTEKQIYRFKKGDSDVSLRFDLTVPLARYVSQHFSDLSFPFRRYQISKVFRGEKSQKGRFREFYQCDIDIIGNGKLSIINDAEIPSIIYSTFKDLGFGSFTIKINNRKLLNGFFEALKITNQVEVLRTIDKIDKIGIEGVNKELNKIGLNEDTINKIMKFIQIKGSNEEVVHKLEHMNIDNDKFKLGLEELSLVVKYIENFGVPKENFCIDLNIARGLDYYTGIIYETFLDDYPNIGSICSGGRYDNLAQHYTKQKLPGVGISIGLTRLFYQLREANIINSNVNNLIKVLVIPMEDSVEEGIKVANNLRKKEICTQIYLDECKMKKKFNFANKLRVSFIIIIGLDEIKQNKVTLKDMESGNQICVSLDEAVNIIKK